MADWGGLGGSFSSIGNSFVRTEKESLGAAFVHGARDEVAGMAKIAEATSRDTWERLATPWRMLRAVVRRQPRQAGAIARAELQREQRFTEAFASGLLVGGRRLVDTGPLAVPHYLEVGRRHGVHTMLQTGLYDAGHATVQVGAALAGEAVLGGLGEATPAEVGPSVDHMAAAVDELAATSPELVPHGFPSMGEVRTFTRPTYGQLEAEGIPGAVTLRGSAVTGVSHDTGLPFDAAGPGRSDLDVGIASEELLARARAAKLPFVRGGSRTLPLRPTQLDRLGLGDALREMRAMSGRKVTIVIYRSVEDIQRRGPMMVLP
ncbi:MAG TPA: hypothetical protein VHN98_09965 [Acidimicrobiales bacterium]|nr:hypothetical protein [Acidimicrobiales bacterium]